MVGSQILNTYFKKNIHSDKAICKNRNNSVVCFMSQVFGPMFCICAPDMQIAITISAPFSLMTHSKI